MGFHEKGKCHFLVLNFRATAKCTQNMTPVKVVNGVEREGK